MRTFDGANSRWSEERLRSWAVLLLGGDRLGEWPYDCRDNVAIHEVLTDLALAAVRLAESLERLTPPVLANREVDADRRFRKLTGPNLIGIRPRLDAQATLLAAGLVEGQHERGFVIDDPAAG